MEFNRFYSMHASTKAFIRYRVEDSDGGRFCYCSACKESDELEAVSLGQTTFWYSDLAWPGQSPSGKASSQAACGLFLGMGCASGLHQGIDRRMTKVTHFSLLHIV